MHFAYGSFFIILENIHSYDHSANQDQTKYVSTSDIRLVPYCKRDLHSSGILTAQIGSLSPKF